MKIFQTLFQLLVLHLIDETPNAPFPWWAHNLLTFEGSQKEGKNRERTLQTEIIELLWIHNP